jgi:hypothetical protein
MGGTSLADEDSSFEDLDVYSEDIDQMDFKVIVVAVLEFISGILGITLTAMNFSMGFPPAPLAYLIAAVSLGVITGTLGIISLIAGWGLWQLEPWAWRTAIAVSVASLFFYLPSLSIIMIIPNVIVIFYLRDQQVRDIYRKIEIP